MKAVVVAGVLALIGAACGGTSRSEQSELRIYDPSGHAGVEITSADIVRSSARAVPQGDGVAIVSFTFTPDGVSKFCRLTHALARRGAELHQRQQFVVQVGDRLEAQPFVDYEATPTGLCGVPGIEMADMPVAAARRLAQLIREGEEAD